MKAKYDIYSSSHSPVGSVHEGFICGSHFHVGHIPLTILTGIDYLGLHDMKYHSRKYSFVNIWRVVHSKEVQTLVICRNFMKVSVIKLSQQITGSPIKKGSGSEWDLMSQQAFCFSEVQAMLVIIC